MTTETRARWIERSGIDRVDFEVLYHHATGRNRTWLYGHDQELATDDERARVEPLIARRQSGEPVAHITGTREFWTLELEVSPATLIPRPETELLVEIGLAAIADVSAPRVLDLGCGTGAIGLAILAERPDATVLAIDISEEATALANRNASRHRLSNRFETRVGSWFQPVTGQFNLIVSNPPYINADDPHLTQGDLRFENPLALTPGPNGIDPYRDLTKQAKSFLSPKGMLAVEHGFDQQDLVVQLFEKAGWQHVMGHRDLSGMPRVVSGLRSPKT